MTQSESITKLAAALAKAQGEFPAVAFNATNPFLKNKYADLGAVIQAARPVLAKHDLAVSQMTTSVPGEVGVTTMLMHSSGEWLQSTVTLPLGEERGKSLAQMAGSVITYLRRYSLAAMLGMYADEDNDGDDKKASPKAQPAPARTAEQATAELTGEPAPAPPPAPSNGQPKDWPADTVKAVADAQGVPIPRAKNALAYCKLPKGTPPIIIVDWSNHYKVARAEVGENGKAKYTPAEAGEIANTEMGVK